MDWPPSCSFGEVSVTISQLLSYSYSLISTNLRRKFIRIVSRALFGISKCRTYWLCIANKSDAETLYMIFRERGGTEAAEKGR